MTIGDRCDCLYCLTPGAYQLKLDCKHRPYFQCQACGARTFLRGEFSMKGPTMLWGKLTIALRAGDVEAARKMVADAVAPQVAEAGAA